mmetsp:Transcript_37297/g.84490  ORF Transcript_37297/g.84490 Transcript_37297/m.84490 type:complete len:368 (-) Transcript_37297:4-1107(-)
MRRLVPKVVRVVDLRCRPDAFVCRVVDLWRIPLALVVGVGDLRRCPLATAPWRLASWIIDQGCLPLAILLRIPIVRRLCLRVGHLVGGVVEPRLRFRRVGVDDLSWRVLVPVLRLRGLGVINLHQVDPIRWLLVRWVVNLLRRVDVWVEVSIFQEVDLFVIFVIDEDLDGVVGADDCSVQVRFLLTQSGERRRREVLLLPFPRLWALVPQDKVDLVGRAALVRTKHDRVRRRIREAVRAELFGCAQQLDVGTTTLDCLRGVKFVLHHEALVFRVICLRENGRHGVLARLVPNLDALVSWQTLRLTVRRVVPSPSELRVLGDNPPAAPVVTEAFEEEGTIEARKGLAGTRRNSQERKHVGVDRLLLGG